MAVDASEAWEWDEEEVLGGRDQKGELVSSFYVFEIKGVKKMPRPRKRRRVCELPSVKIFGPLGKVEKCDKFIILTIEEYEVIRLIDLEGLEQESCAEIMNVARSTVQRMYIEAKKKIADSLVNVKNLKIEGGDYILCDKNDIKCSTCFRRCHRRRGENL